MLTVYRLGRVSVVETPEGCHEWQGGVNSKGYPCSTIDGRRVLMHRVVFDDERGPLGDDEHVHHACENKLCLNPYHMEATDARAHNRRHAGDHRAGRILALLADGQPRRIVEVARSLGEDYLCVKVTIERCVKSGELERIARGVYRLSEGAHDG